MHTAKVGKVKKFGFRATILALISALTIALFGGSALADDRDKWVEQKEQAENDRAVLEQQLIGLDKELQDLYLKLDDVRREIPVAQGELSNAEAELASAQREYEQVTDQLNAAVDEKERIDAEIKKADEESDRTRSSMAQLAREMYRSGETTSSPLVIAMTSKSTADITKRAAGAQTVATAQSRAFSSARESVAVEKNRMARQEALTERIQGLQERAAKAQNLAESARALAAEKLTELEDLEKTETVRAAKVEEVQEEAKRQLEASERAFQEAKKNIARIDEENRRLQQEWQQNQSGNQGGSGGSSVSTSGVFGYPLPQAYPVTSGYGYRYHPILGIYKLHSGVDYGAPCGVPALATANGVVSEVSYNPVSGNYVTLNYGLINGNSYQAMFIHLQSAAVVPGQRVTRGQTVGYVGSTGGSTGCHLHYEFIRNGYSVDGRNYM
ncbi:MAG TPA: peptidoglycan DD-metalloendopeptidase family protein [Actinomyces sp.]|jgi:murein DD-endopeptidase MepM/ murein hydrolase activator NlpD|nr:peptidoglycan DD-metalloendopeptidase family protein [Acidobacteriota bacterium]HHT41552.1 peptidoglycan DD-metalloendopeptidase family protein [Actinomyces sp.]